MTYLAFCGGMMDGKVIRFSDVIQFYWVPITEYKWSDDKLFFADKNEAFVWHWNHTHKDFKDWGAIMPGGPTLLEQMWAELDAGYKKLVIQGPAMDEGQYKLLQGYLRGVAWCIAHFMKPLFSSADAVVTECMKRYEFSLDPESTYETPGLGSRRSESVRASKYATATASDIPLDEPKHNLDNNQIEKLKQARASGMFSDNDLCEMYDLSIEVLRSL